MTVDELYEEIAGRIEEYREAQKETNPGSYSLGWLQGKVAALTDVLTYIRLEKKKG